MSAALGTLIKDIHEPAAITFWPIGPIWMMLYGFLLVLVLGLSFWWYKNRFKRHAKHLLNEIKQDYLRNSNHSCAADMAVWVRGYAQHHSQLKNLLHLTGMAWLEALDKSCTSTGFTQGPGRLLLEAPYRADSNQDLTELFDWLDTWLRRV